MPRPDTLRPPPSRRPPPRPPKSRRWVVAGILAVVAIGLPATLLLLKRNEKEPGCEERADEFVKGIVTGSGLSASPRSRTGYAAAYETLSEALREAVPFDVFFEKWSRLVDGKGFIVDYVRTSETRLPDRRRRKPGVIRYVLFLGGENQDHASLECVELKLHLTFNWGAGQYEVSEFSENSVPNPRATR